MRKLVPLKFFAAILLLAMLAVTVNGVHESAHAMTTVTGGSPHSVTAPQPVDANDTPCTPFEHHQDHDGCDSCVNCSCHASMTVWPFVLDYNPVISALSLFDPFKHLPEVYLSKFVPPQIRA